MKILLPIFSFLPPKALPIRFFGILLLSLCLTTLLAQSSLLFDDRLAMPLNNRMLSEAKEESPDQPETPLLNKPSLSIGKVVGSLKIDAQTMAISKDHKTAFVMATTMDQLKVLDISDFEFPRLISSIDFSQPWSYFNSRGMVISPDGNFLFMSNSHFLQVFEISEPEYPVHIAQVEDVELFEKTGNYQTPEVYNPKLIFSKDNKFLFVGGVALQVFDISDPTKPIFVSSQMSSVSFKPFTWQKRFSIERNVFDFR